MNFISQNAQLYIPDGAPAEAALARTTHLGISAHQDDLEIMAVDGILQCFQQKDKWFSGLVVTDGRGSPRSGFYKDYSDDEMRQVRQVEQKKAAFLGEYGALVLLDYPSPAVKEPGNKHVVTDMASVIKQAHPDTIYTHNLADKHPTHVAVALKAIEAIRSLSEIDRPHRLYGCEVWRDLDWMVDEDKVALDCSAHESLQAALLGVFDSQIAGGKRYDLATMGRRRANATYFSSHGLDTSTALTYAMDLTPLIREPWPEIGTFIEERIQRFASSVLKGLL